MFNKFSLPLFGLLLKDVFTNAVSLPAVTGNHSVGALDFELTDYARPNPFAPGPRKFIITLHYPAKSTKNYPLAPYMSPATASYWEQSASLPNGTFSTILSNSYTAAPLIQTKQAQLLLLSTGYGGSRYWYATLAEDLASHGYLVATIDHPYDAPIVEFADGSVILADPATNITDPTTLSILLDLRVKDAEFALDLLLKNLTQHIPGVHRRFKINGVGMLGHSFGGAATAEVLLQDDRVEAGINLDGSVYGDVVQEGFDKPFVFMGTPVHNITNDATWETLWGNLEGWKKTLVIDGARHLAYGDFTTLVDLLGARELFPPEYVELFGTINGLRACAIQRAYVRDFFGWVLRGHGGALFEGPSDEFPEVVFQ